MSEKLPEDGGRFSDKDRGTIPTTNPELNENLRREGVKPQFTVEGSPDPQKAREIPTREEADRFVEDGEKMIPELKRARAGKLLRGDADMVGVVIGDSTTD